MNKTSVFLLITASLIVGCSTTDSQKRSDTAVSQGGLTPISEQRASLEFKRRGLRFTHTFSGKIESIEATGYAPIWGGSQNATREAIRVAELEAKKILNDFLNEEVLTSSVSVSMISKNLEKASDRKSTVNLARDAGVIALTADDEIGAPATKEISNSSLNAARSDALRIATDLKTTITLNNKGILTGLYLVDAEVVDGGKNVRATYRWDRKTDDSRREVREAMRR